MKTNQFRDHWGSHMSKNAVSENRGADRFLWTKSKEGERQRKKSKKVGREWKGSKESNKEESRKGGKNVKGKQEGKLMGMEGRKAEREEASGKREMMIKQARERKKKEERKGGRKEGR